MPGIVREERTVKVGYRGVDDLMALRWPGYVSDSECEKLRMSVLGFSTYACESLSDLLQFQCQVVQSPIRVL